jgi:hypothetical protein
MKAEKPELAQITLKNELVSTVARNGHLKTLHIYINEKV